MNLTASPTSNRPRTLAVLAGALARATPPSRPPGAAGVSHDRSLQRHLARCRRRNEGALLLVATAPGAAALASEIRMADAVRIRSGRHVDEVVLLVDDDTDLAGVQARWGAAIAGLRCGWAAFPQDGVLLEELVAAARARVGTALPTPDLAPAPACAVAG